MGYRSGEEIDRYENEIAAMKLRRRGVQGGGERAKEPDRTQRRGVQDGGERPEQPDRTQRREYVRVRTTRPVLVSWGAGSSQARTHSVDISGRGILLTGPERLRVGDTVELQIAITESGSPIAAGGTVVRANSSGRRSIVFDRISEGDRRRLVRFLFELQRIERSRGLRLVEPDGR